MSRKVGNIHAVGLRLGNPVPDEGRVVHSRPLMMPDDTTLRCRQRERADGTRYWTAEVPVDVAKAAYPERESAAPSRVPPGVKPEHVLSEAKRDRLMRVLSNYNTNPNPMTAKSTVKAWVDQLRKDKAARDAGFPVPENDPAPEPDKDEVERERQAAIFDSWSDEGKRLYYESLQYAPTLTVDQHDKALREQGVD